MAEPFAGRGPIFCRDIKLIIALQEVEIGVLNYRSQCLENIRHLVIRLYMLAMVILLFCDAARSTMNK